MRIRRYAFEFVCLLGVLLTHGSFVTVCADTFSYAFSTTVNQAYGDTLGLGYDTLGTITGTFTIDTSTPPSNCPSEGCFNTENPPTITSSVLWTPTNGPTVAFSNASIDIVTGGAVDTVPETCSMDPGTWCGFLIGVGSGELAFGGFLGQPLAIGGYDNSYWNVDIPSLNTTDPGYDTVVQPATATVTPEPPTGVLFLLCTILVFISVAKARRFWVRRSQASGTQLRCF